MRLGLFDGPKSGSYRDFVAGMDAGPIISGTFVRVPNKTYMIESIITYTKEQTDKYKERTKIMTIENEIRKKLLKAEAEDRLRAQFTPFSTEMCSKGCWPEFRIKITHAMEDARYVGSLKILYHDFVYGCHFTSEEQVHIRKELGSEIADWLGLEKAEEVKVVLLRDVLPKTEIVSAFTVTKGGTNRSNYRLTNPLAARDLLNEVYPVEQTSSPKSLSADHYDVLTEAIQIVRDHGGDLRGVARRTTMGVLSTLRNRFEEDE